MRKYIVTSVFLAFALTSAVSAQPLSVGGQGSRAVLFNFSGLGNLNLTGYDGGIGGKYFIDQDVAIRGMLMFGIDNTSTNNTGGAPQPSTDRMSFGIQGGLEYHLPLNSNVSPYLGGLVSFSTNAATNNPGAAKVINNMFGLSAVGGVEYFFNQNISLSAEYQFGLTTTSGSNSNGPSTNRLQLGFQTAGLTMAVYF